MNTIEDIETNTNNLHAICAICETDDSAALYKGLVKCKKCGFVWANSEIPDSELEKLYANNYFFGGEYKDYIAEEEPLIKDFKRNFELLKPFSQGGKLLEIGSAYGFSLNLAKQTFSEVMGVEINKEAADYSAARFKLDVKAGDFLKLDLPENYFDAVVSWATFEHLPTPHLYLEKVSRLLKKGGVFACTTIDIDAFVPRLRGPKWRQIHPPTHVSYYSARTLKLLLSKYHLNPVYTSYVGHHRSFDNVFYGILVLIYKKERIYNLLKKMGLTKGSFYLNLYDIIYVVAKKD